MSTFRERFQKAKEDHVGQHATGKEHFCAANRCGSCGQPLQWVYEGMIGQIIVPEGITYLESSQIADIYENDAKIEPCMNPGCDYRIYAGRQNRCDRLYYLPGGKGYAA